MRSVGFGYAIRLAVVSLALCLLGLLPKLLRREVPTQLKCEVPVAGTRDSGQRFTAGLGAAKVRLKLIFPLLVSKDFDYVTLVVNGAVNRPLHDSDRHTTGPFGAGLGLAITRKFAAMAELHAGSRFDLAHDRLLTANLGLMRAGPHGAVLDMNVGHSPFSDDGAEHAYVGAGVKVLIKPSKASPQQMVRDGN